MHYALEAHFGEDKTKQIATIEKSIQAELDLEFQDVFPHLSFCSFESSDIDHALPKIAEAGHAKQDLQLKFDGLACFKSGNFLLYLSIKKSQELFKIHRDFDSLLRTEGTTLNDLYSPKNWIPHVSLTGLLNRSQFEEAAQIGRRYDCSFDFEIRSLKVVRYPGANSVFKL